MKRFKVAAGVAALAVFFLILPVEALLQGDPRLPEGKAKELVASVCTQCHALETVTSQKKTKKEWEETVNRMIATNGAQIQPEDAQAIIDYLAENFNSESKPAAAKE